MTPERAIGAVSRLSSVAMEYPELASEITNVIAGMLVKNESQEYSFSVSEKRANANGHVDHAVAVATNLHRGGRTSNPQPVVDVVIGSANGRPKEWYTQTEVAGMFGRLPFTVGQWCRDGRIRAEKVSSVQSGTMPWRISADEVKRFNVHGFLPFCKCRNK